MHLRRNLQFARSIRILSFLLILSMPITAGGWLWAEELSNYGSPVSATPFDVKLNSIGFFNEPTLTYASTGHAQSIENLFLTARAFRYVHSAFNDRWQTAEETATKRSGDCKDKAVWLYAQLRRNGYHNVHLVIGKYRPNETVFHAWVTCVDESGNAYLLDPSLQKGPKEIWDFSEKLYRPIYSFGGSDKMYSAYRFPINF